MSQSLTQLGVLRTSSRSQYGKVTTSSDSNSVDIRKSRSTRISLVNRVPMLQLSKARVCFTLATAEELSSNTVSFVTAPVPSEYTEEERRILLVIPQWTSDMLTKLGRVTCHCSWGVTTHSEILTESGCVLKWSFRSNVMTGLLWGLPVEC